MTDAQGPPLEARNQIAQAYREMAKKARYRPAAPSDGFGNITVPLKHLNLAEEAGRYAERWWAEEDEFVFSIGCCNFPTRPATIYAVEAARQMCGGDLGEGPALELLRMAVRELETQANGK